MESEVQPDTPRPVVDRAVTVVVKPVVMSQGWPVEQAGAARLVRWQIDALGVTGAIVLGVASLLWSCSAWLIVGEWRRLRRRSRR